MRYGKGKQKKVKSKASSSPKYITSYEDTLSSDNYAFSDDDDSVLSELVKKPNAMIKGIMKQVRARDELLKQQEELLVQQRNISEELKKLLSLKKGKVEKFDQELAQSKETTCNQKSFLSDPKAPKASTSKGCKRLYNIDINASCSNVEKMLLETCDETIAQENDYLREKSRSLNLK
jgi:hypothetical protein